MTLTFLQKPFMPETLARKVREILDREDSGRAGRGPRLRRSRAK